MAVHESLSDAGFMRVHVNCLSRRYYPRTFARKGKRINNPVGFKKREGGRYLIFMDGLL